METNTNERSFESLNIDLENYFSNTIIPQLFVDRTMRVRKFTPPAMKQFNLRADDVGKPITELSDNFRFPHLIENIIQVTESHNILEKEIQTTDMRWYQMNILPYIVKESRQFNDVIITFVDITARINDLKELENLIAEHQLLVDGIIHDMKNPLTSLLLAVEMVKLKTVRSAETFSDLEIISRSATRIKEMTEEFIDIGRKSSIHYAEAELLNVENVIEDVYLALTKQIQDAGVRIQTDLRISQIYFSRRKLRSIFYNLLSNAIKYRTSEGPCEIRVRAYPENENIILEVHDNGIGIAKEKHELIFTKYYRGQHQVEGSGIGLYLVKEIILSEGGKITVDSEPGKGTVFTLHLRTV